MIAYPIQLNNTGGLAESVDPIGDQIRFLLETRYWERVMLPDFGIPDRLFEPVTATDLSTLIAAVTIAIGFWIGEGVTVIATEIPEEGFMGLEIHYGGLEPILFNTSTYLFNQ